MGRLLLARARKITLDWVEDESGNAAVDWVVLVAGLVALSVTVMVSIGGGVEVLADNTGAALDNREVSTY